MDSKETLISEVMKNIGQKIESELEAMYADETYIARKLCTLRDADAD